MLSVLLFVLSYAYHSYPLNSLTLPDVEIIGTLRAYRFGGAPRLSRRSRSDRVEDRQA